MTTTTTTAFIVLCGALLVNGAFIRRPHVDGRVVGGVDAEIADHPYQLSLRSDGYSLCGAIIVTDMWVMTAAHCVYDATMESMVIRAGSSKLNSGGILHEVTQVAMHEDYVRDTNDYDFAVLKVDPPFTFGPGVQPIALVTTEPAAGEHAVVSGWGTLSPWGGGYSDQLQAANISIYDREQCAKNYNKLQPVTASMICAGLPEGGVDHGIGDGGGPLVVDGKLAGVVSWGAAGAKPGLPGVYANVAVGVNWIKRVTFQ